MPASPADDAASPITLLKLVVVATVLSVLAAFLAPAGLKRVDAALERGYVDVGSKRRSGSEEYIWKARHTKAGQPYRFHASLVPWLAGPLFLLLAACLAWLQVLQLVRTGHTRPAGWYRTATLWLGGAAAAACAATLFFWVPLR